jgi:hypothetical protein
MSMSDARSAPPTVVSLKRFMLFSLPAEPAQIGSPTLI